MIIKNTGIDIIIGLIVVFYLLFSGYFLFITNTKYSCFANASSVVNISNFPSVNGLSIQQNFIFISKNGSLYLFQYAYFPYLHKFVIKEILNGKMISEKILSYNLDTNLIHLSSTTLSNGTILVSFNNKTFELVKPSNANETSSMNKIEIETNTKISLPSSFYCD